MPNCSQGIIAFQRAIRRYGMFILPRDSRLLTVHKQTIARTRYLYAIRGRLVVIRSARLEQEGCNKHRTNAINRTMQSRQMLILPNERVPGYSKQL